jgi:Tol biopolymer transport system component
LNKAQFSLSKEGTLMFGGADDRYDLAWLSRDGKVLGTVSTPRRYAAIRLSPDGNDVALSFLDPSGNRDIWQMELARGLPNRLTHGAQGFVPVWSPDSRQIAYHDASQIHLLMMNADGDRQQIVMESKGHVNINDWSPDGQFLMYTEISETTSHDLWRLPTTQSGKPEPFLVTPFDESHGQFYPDGSWVAYTSNESGQQEIYVRSVTGKGSTRVSTNGGSFSRWRKDGRELFYRSLNGSLMSASVATGGDGLKFGTPTSLLPLVEPLGTFAYPYDVAPDGQKILTLTPSSSEVAPLMVIVNWEASLRK